MKIFIVFVLVFSTSITNLFAQNSAEIVKKAYGNFKVDYKLGTQESIETKLVENVSAIIALEKFKHPLGFAQIEVYEK